jgi:FtsZ-interacting cell division protein ZipA
MNTSTVWIMIAVVAAVLIIAAVIVAVSRATRRRRTRQAEEIRERAKLETAKVDRRQALADETAAKARAAQAEAEAKAAEANRLQERAAAHHSEAATSREQLQDEWKRADKIDPATQAPETPDRDQHAGDEAWSAESPVRQDDVPTDDFRDAGHSGPRRGNV